MSIASVVDGDELMSSKNKFVQVEKNSYKFDCQHNLCWRKRAVLKVSPQNSNSTCVPCGGAAAKHESINLFFEHRHFQRSPR